MKRNQTLGLLLSMSILLAASVSHADLDQSKRTATRYATPYSTWDTTVHNHWHYTEGKCAFNYDPNVWGYTSNNTCYSDQDFQPSSTVFVDERWYNQSGDYQTGFHTNGYKYVTVYRAKTYSDADKICDYEVYDDGRNEYVYRRHYYRNNYYVSPQAVLAGFGIELLFDGLAGASYWSQAGTTDLYMQGWSDIEAGIGVQVIGVDVATACPDSGGGDAELACFAIAGASSLAGSISEAVGKNKINQSEMQQAVQSNSTTQTQNGLAVTPAATPAAATKQ